MTVERRAALGEIRVEGRKLSGTVMRYGDVSPTHRERFEPGSLRLADSVHLDLFHDVERAVAWHPGGGLSLDNGRDALTMRAELPPIPAANRALAEIRAGRVGGLSVEFKALQETRVDGLRVIQDALLSGVGIVRAPSYGQSQVEARARGGRASGTIPYGRRVQCECHQSGDQCDTVSFERGAFQAAMADKDDVIAVYKDYAGPLASLKRGTLRTRETDDGLEVEIDLPGNETARNLIGASETVPIYIRPLFDQDASEFVEESGIASYRRVGLRAFLIGATDRSRGWPEARIAGTAPDEASAAAPRRKRRVWL